MLGVLHSWCNKTYQLKLVYSKACSPHIRLNTSVMVVKLGHSSGSLSRD